MYSSKGKEELEEVKTSPQRCASTFVACSIIYAAHLALCVDSLWRARVAIAGDKRLQLDTPDAGRALPFALEWIARVTLKAVTVLHCCVLINHFHSTKSAVLLLLQAQTLFVAVIFCFCSPVGL